MSRCLITYCLRQREGGYEYGYQVDDPVHFARETNKFGDAPYFIVNALPLTDEQADEFDGELKGM